MRILFVFVTLLAFSSFSQGSFQKSFGDSGDEVAFNVTELKDSTFVLTGYTTSFNSDKDIIVINIDSLGTTNWIRTLRGNKIDIARKIAATSDGGFVLVGSTASFGEGRRDIFVAKLDAQGKTEWSKTYGGDDTEYAFAIHPTTDKGYIISGETSSFDVEATDILVMKIDSVGNLSWSKSIGGEDVEYAFDALEHYDGYIVGFETNTWSVGNKDIGLLKLDKNGDLVWMHTYGGKDEDNLTAMLTDKEGTIAMVGLTSSFGFGNLDGYFIKCDKEGQVIFSKSYGDKGADVFHGIVKTPEGYVMSGFSNSFNNQLLEEDVLLVKVNQKGRTKWSKTFGGKYSDVGLNMIYTSKGEVLIVGKTESFSGRDDDDIFVIKSANNNRHHTCEQDRVQLVDQKAVFITKSHQPDIKDISIETDEANFENNLQSITETNICSNGELLINKEEEAEEIVK